MEYQFRCNVCGQDFTVSQAMDDEHTAEHCGVKAQRIFTPLGVSVAFRDGFNVGLGKHFNTQREMDYYAASNGWRQIKC